MTEPGWYPDPDDASLARYWDGSAWTDRTQARSEPESREPPPADGAGGSSSPSLLRRPVAWVAVVVVLALVAGLLFVVLGSDSASAGEVILEPSAADGDDPFFESVATAAVEVESGGVAEVAGGGDSVESLSGSTPGLYGGTGDDAVCDPAGLVAFLEENSEKAAAFADVLGIAPADIEDYVAGLTPVLLREDTRVTNHGFESGRATARQSVFQAGTAVLVDDRGVPRVRCACGNPLTEPDAASGSYEGDAWPGFDDTRLVAVAPADEPQTQLELVDVNTGQPLTVAVGGSGGLTVEQLLNVEVPFFCDTGGAEQMVPLVDGQYECPNPPSSRPNDPNYRIWVTGSRADVGETGPPRAAVGDLTGDGRDEGVILTNYAGGQAGAGPTLPMVFSSEGDYLLTGPDDLPGRPTDVRISLGRIEFDGFLFGECNACPPGPPYTAFYSLVGNELVPGTAR